MDNSKLRWVQPNYTFGTNESEAPAPLSKRKRSTKKPVEDDGKQPLTVSQAASLLNLSPDTIRRMFRNEPGIITLGTEPSRGKRGKITMRIPREVFERVKRKRAKK